MVDLSETIKANIIAVLREEKSVKQAILFGSRARGDARYNSDIDLALLGDAIPLSLHTKLRRAAGLYTLDIVSLDRLENDDLIESIERDGVVIYNSETATALAQ